MWKPSVSTITSSVVSRVSMITSSYSGRPNRSSREGPNKERTYAASIFEPLSNRPQWILQWHECSLQRVVDDPGKHPLPPEQTHPFQTSATSSKLIRQDIELTSSFSSGEVIHISSLALLKVWLLFKDA